jgi:hypothetical protein
MDRPEELRRTVLNNQRRTGREKVDKHQRLRSERVERSFSHNCATRGARRTWLRGLKKVMKCYLITVAAHSVGRVIRKVFGLGKPRVHQEVPGVGAWPIGVPSDRNCSFDDAE